MSINAHGVAFEVQSASRSSTPVTEARSGTGSTLQEDTAVPFVRQIQQLSETELQQDPQIGALLDVLENLTSHPDALAKAFAYDARKVTGNYTESQDNWKMLRHYLWFIAEEMAETRHAVQALRASGSWRLTAPLRTFLDGLRIILGVARNCGRGFIEPAKIAGLVEWLRFRKLVLDSGLFDEQYYLRSNPDVLSLRIPPLFHFFVFGVRECRDPHFLFDVRYYTERNRGLLDSFTNPLVHYLTRGAYEGRDPHPLFDSSFYLEQNPDVRKAGWNPLSHYLGPGIAEGRNPNSQFGTTAYLERHPDVAVYGLNPLIHYVDSIAERRWRIPRRAAGV